MTDPIVLDCTLRDGGYYNAWDFSPVLVDRYFRAMEDSGIDVVELGFRFPPGSEYRGPFAYTTDSFLAGVELPKGPTLGVMLNASDLIDDPVATIDALFADADRSPVELVRIASHFHHVEPAKSAVQRLCDLGYRVGFNFMQCSTKPAEEVQALAGSVQEWDLVEVLYFADSLGNMNRPEVERFVAVLADAWSGELGIHTHDNRSRALDNSLAALGAGATWLDATVLGMGRGAGNCRTDFLLFELRDLGNDAYRPEALLNLTERDFAELRRVHEWGTNLLYFKSAADSIHPTYVQLMQSDDRYGMAEMVGVLDALASMGGDSFKSQNLGLAAQSHQADGDGSWDATGWVDGRDVLVLGSGPSVADHADTVARYIEEHDPLVLCLNTSTPVAADHVDAYVACHPSRLVLEGGRISTLTRPLLAPGRVLDLLHTARPAEVLDYGIAVEEGTFDVRATGCTVPARLALAYALAAATAGGAERILLVGVDGYAAGDARQEEQVEMFGMFQAMPGAPELLALTPTTYPIPQGSVYAPRT